MARWLEWSSAGQAKVKVTQKEMRGGETGHSCLLFATPGRGIYMRDRNTTEQVLYAEK